MHQVPPQQHGKPPPPPVNIPTSEIVVDPQAFELVPRSRGADLLTLAPGVVLLNHSGEGHAPTLFLRGFDAGEGQDFAIDVEGIPLNEPSNAHGHGYADVGFVIPEVVRRVRVLEGPFDPRQGDFAVAGSASYELGSDRRGVITRVGLGSFGEKRLALVVAPASMDPGTFAAVDLRQGDGFGPNRAHASVSALAQYRQRFGSTTISILGGTSALTFDAVGVVRADAIATRSLPCADDFDSQRFCWHDAAQGGTGSRHLVSLRVDHRMDGAELSQQLFASLRTLRIRENFTGALLDERGDGLDDAAGRRERAEVCGRGRPSRRPHDGDWWRRL